MPYLLLLFSKPFNAVLDNESPLVCRWPCLYLSHFFLSHHSYQRQFQLLDLTLMKEMQNLWVLGHIQESSIIKISIMFQVAIQLLSHIKCTNINLKCGNVFFFSVWCQFIHLTVAILQCITWLIFHCATGINIRRNLTGMVTRKCGSCDSQVAWKLTETQVTH